MGGPIKRGRGGALFTTRAGRLTTLSTVGNSMGDIFCILPIAYSKIPAKQQAACLVKGTYFEDTTVRRLFQTRPVAQWGLKCRRLLCF